MWRYCWSWIRFSIVRLGRLLFLYYLDDRTWCAYHKVLWFLCRVMKYLNWLYCSYTSDPLPHITIFLDQTLLWAPHFCTLFRARFWCGCPIYSSWIGPKILDGLGVEHGMLRVMKGALVLYLFWVQLMVPVYSKLSISNTSTLGIVDLFGLKRALVPLVYSWRLVLSNPKRDFTKSEWTIHDQLRRQHFFFFKKTNFRDKYHYPKRPKVSSTLELLFRSFKD